jgi:hypothetical protein
MMTISTTLGLARAELGTREQPEVLPISQHGRFARWNVERKARAAQETSQDHAWRDRMALRDGRERSCVV